MKRFSAIALCAALILTMTGCTGGNSSSSDSSSSSSSSSQSSSDSGTSAPESSSTGSSEENSTESESTPEIEEIPYTLGGELTPTMIANSRYNVGNQVRLANVIKKLQAGEDVTVAYLGGSITQGTSAGNDLCYARLTTNWLEEKFPDANITYVNAGIGATGSYIGVHRADKDVLSKDPDLIFIDFSVNDTTERTAVNTETYASLLRKLWNHSSSPAIVTVAMTQDNGTSFIQYHGEVVKKFDIPMISYKDTILDVIDKGYIKWTDISDDNIHPNVPGHAILSGLITNYLQSVIDDLDNISGAESDFASVTDIGNTYVNAKLLMSDDTEPVSLGGFQAREMNFGNFMNPWVIRATDGQFTDADAIEFEFEGTNVGLLYGKLTSNSCKADVYLDGEVVTTIDAAFPNGWGNYVEFEQIKTGLPEGKHTLKIAPKAQDGAAQFYVSAVAVS
ncbi:MAG: SGNH/GDSL hydrolase family protein [Lachnospiraceae bacterium]|nr:SGNH/GDSL hydrolase family protein [Ruminococcus sp.]MCM1276069.1 SGNH/GDSL hydrolase family protein [Lachnospiraceae bacterium]